MPPPAPSLLPPPGTATTSLFTTHPSGAVTTTAPSPTNLLFHAALTVRAAVFVLEQHCSAAAEIDADDAVSWHWVIFAREEEGAGGRRGKEGGEVPAATVRLVPAQTHKLVGRGGDGGEVGEDGVPCEPDYARSEVWDGAEAFVKIGRLATVRGCRGRGLGRVLVEAAMQFAGGHGREMVSGKGVGVWKGLVCAHAQVGVEGWYCGLGFVSDGGMGRWVEEGIEHVGVWRRVEVGGMRVGGGGGSSG